MFNAFLENVYALAARVPFDMLAGITFGAFGAVYLVCLVLTFASPKFKRLSKRPFMAFVNAFSAVTLALFCAGCGFTEAVFAAVFFWIAGYILYGTLCAASVKGEARRSPSAQMLPVTPSRPAYVPAAMKSIQSDVPAARNSVRLEHAVSVTDKLLEKNLGKSDRQELEKLRDTLAALQIKGTLNTAESEILNENFNTLLKLMAKYNV